ncbi:alpha/beta-hydrolase [Mycena metata]|uniref:Alpha/beta-hydrolase n=1 Tax=Mycena metata TaxID=1033252 RepID=A0AAD7MTC4_9AGAR|nr:alpha/beta-hydrolase [Mycena metata]
MTTTRTSISIPSLTPGWNLDTWCYIPISSPGPHPVIVMANGLGCNKLLGLGAYAEAFSAAGYACLVFDYRRWGASDGTRRNSVYVAEQQEDYRTVIKYARQQPQFDPNRVIAWGFSFAGGHVLTLAGDPALNLVASISNNAYCGRSFPPFQFTRWYITSFMLGLLDFIAGFLHLPPVYIPVVAPPGAMCALPVPGAPAGFATVTEKPRDFPNQIAASIFFRSPLHHRPQDTLHLIRRPILLIAGKRDYICPAVRIVETSRVVGTAELVELPGDHFDIFRGNDNWEEAIRTQIAFLRKYAPI